MLNPKELPLSPQVDQYLETQFTDLPIQRNQDIFNFCQACFFSINQALGIKTDDELSQLTLKKPKVLSKDPQVRDLLWDLKVLQPLSYSVGQPELRQVEHPSIVGNYMGKDLRELKRKLLVLDLHHLWLIFRELTNEYQARVLLSAAQEQPSMVNPKAILANYWQ
jgi:hypothetical protein